MFRYSKLLAFVCTNLVFLCTSPTAVTSDRILVIWPLPAGSHFRSFQPLFEKLVTRGHDVTIVSGHRLNASLQSSYVHIDLSHKFKDLDIVFTEMRELTRIGNIKFCFKKIYDYSEVVLREPVVQNLLRSNVTFDLVMANMFFLDAFISFGYHFNAPVIGLCAQTLAYHDWMLGNPLDVSYVPHVYLPMTEKMTFVERFINAGYNLFTMLYMETIAYPSYQRQIEKYIPFDPKPVPQLRHLVTNVSAVLVNSHFSINFVRPMLPNVIPVGGMHIKARKSLPQDIQKFMDEAKHGVIYVSFGSLIEPENLEEIGKILVNRLAQRPERVLLKWKPSQLSRIPSNFLVKNWMPQVDILSHPNCRLFLTHGGLNSIFEALNATVPLIGLPFFTDHSHGMAAVEYLKLGKTLHFETLDAQLVPTVDKMLSNTKYRENMRKRVRLFVDRQSSPLETAVYWVEYVLRHRDTSHLRPQSVKMSWFTYYSLDIILFTFFLLYLFFCSVMSVYKIFQPHVTNILLYLLVKPSGKEKLK